MGLNCARFLHVWRYATVDNNVPSSGAVHALWTRMYLPLMFCVCLRHVALSADVDGKIRLISISSRLANAKPLLSSLLVYVDDVRDRTNVSRGFPLVLGQFVSPPRRLAPLRCLAPRGFLSPCLVTSNSHILLTQSTVSPYFCFPRS